MIYDYSTGIGVDSAKQRAQRIVKADDKNRRAECLQILRHKTHPKFFARTNDKDGDEQDDEVPFEPEESSERFQRWHVRVLSDSLALFKSTQHQKLRRVFVSKQRTAGARAISVKQPACR
jgi:hypothetical protein